MIEPPDAELLQAQPDLYSRHYRAFAGIELLRREGLLPKRLRIYDVGGGTGLTRRFFPDDEVVIGDVLDDGEIDHVLIPGEPLPVSDGSFDVVVSFDTLEHVLPEQRAAFVSECQRIATSLVVMTLPNGNDEVVATEAVMLKAAEAATGERHPWLSEHVEYGLPSSDEVAGWADATAFSWIWRSSSPLPVWAPRLATTLAHERMVDTRALVPLVRAWNERFMAWDGATPAYRLLAVGHAPDLPADAVGQAFHAGSGDPALGELEQRIREYIALGELITSLEGSRHEARSAYESERDAGAKYRRAYDEAASEARRRAEDLSRVERDLLSKHDETLALLAHVNQRDVLLRERDASLAMRDELLEALMASRVFRLLAKIGWKQGRRLQSGVSA